MSDSLLIVSFSPVQSFIAEARRVADLSAGSEILTRLAQATCKALGENVIYPQDNDQNDAPNVLVAVVATGKVKDFAKAAETALRDEWKSIAQKARQKPEGKLRPDAEWNEIWNRQIANQWEYYWGAAELGDDYRVSYKQARKALDAAKRARFFGPAEEDGLKDSLSGARSALRTNGLNAKDYWQQVFKRLDQNDDVRLRDNERLDAVGVVKRFYVWAGGKRKGFDSANDVAASAYLKRADKTLLANHARSVSALLGKSQFWGNDRWPTEGLDADLLYEEALTEERLKSDYGLTTIDPLKLKAAQRTLAELYEKSGRPPTYYAIVVFDGDNMGAAVDACQKVVQHKQFSQDLSKFARQVRDGMANQPGQVIYAGGDDVLALLPIDTALERVAEWANMFATVKDANGKACSASAGIAIVHHRFPLSAALRAARDAERGAKTANRHKASAGTICIHWLKRSGEELRVRSPWSFKSFNVVPLINQAREDFNKKLSTRLPYELAHEANLAAVLPEEQARKALIKRLLARHWEQADSATIEERAQAWLDLSNALDEALPQENENEYATSDDKRKVGFRELARWLILARFLNQAVKGGE